MLAGVPAGVCAQTAPLSIAVDGSITASDNGGLSPPGLERKELIGSIRPSVTFSRRAAGLDLRVEAAATLLGYARGTQDSGVLPDVRASLKAAMVERLLFIDASARVRQSEVDPFGSRSGDTTGANRRTESSYRVGPYLEREILPHTTLLARHDASLTTNAAGTGRRLESHLTLLRLERAPVRLGGAIELSRLDNESREVGSSRFTLDTARLRGSIDVGEGLVLGAVAGSDRSRLLLSEHTDALYGATAQWNPGPRTALSAQIEHRFFGRAGALSLNHRTPFMSFALVLNRQPVMASSTLGVIGPGSDVRGFLDAILTTRYPDPAARAELVNTLVATRGLDTRGTDPIDVVADYAQLQTAASATWVLLGSRNTVALNLYAQTLRQLIRDDDPLSAVAGLADNRQTGGSLQLSRRLTPLLSVDAVMRWSKIVGLAARSGDVSEDRIFRVSLMRSLTPRTGISAGLGRTLFTTTVSGQHSFDATLVLVGMSHRF